MIYLMKQQDIQGSLKGFTVTIPLLREGLSNQFPLLHLISIRKGVAIPLFREGLSNLIVMSQKFIKIFKSQFPYFGKVYLIYSRAIQSMAKEDVAIPLFREGLSNSKTWKMRRQYQKEVAIPLFREGLSNEHHLNSWTATSKEVAIPLFREGLSN